MIERLPEIQGVTDIQYEAQENIIELGEQAVVGLALMPSRFHEWDGFHWNPSQYNVTSIDGRGVDRTVEADRVTYSYSLREYRGTDVYPSAERVVHSSSRCIGRRYYNGTFYANGQAVASPDHNESANINNEPEFARVWLALLPRPDHGANFYWAVPYRGASKTDNYEDPSACATTYITGGEGWLYDESSAKRYFYTIYECLTCLTEKNHKPGFRSNFFHGCPTENALYAAGIALRIGGGFGVLGSIMDSMVSITTEGTGRDDRIAFRRYPIDADSHEFVDEVPEGYPDIAFESPPNDWFKYPIHPNDELHVADSTARVPILAFLGAEERLARVTLEKDAFERTFSMTKLEVKWDRAISTLAALLAGQVLVIGVVFWACRGVPIRDHDSYLSVARLLRTAMDSVEGGSSDSGRELAQRIQDELTRRAQNEDAEVSKLEIRYGLRTRPNEDGGELAEVDIWSDVKGFDRQLPYD
ncbi:hypothetical protein N656DRAFT_616015 [Canariomyces notabilis]|uniref:Uncharacterized protein n=1 Tax=Canariomyces notabilis TaxID=2074819 RepID=A0AAN6TFA3_9PEZI|nr:hypothetical protein N656DRAFT_616015 [Canariomyces arenarius]